MQKGDKRFIDLEAAVKGQMSQPTLTKRLRVLMSKRLVKIKLQEKNIVYSTSLNKDETQIKIDRMERRIKDLVAVVPSTKEMIKRKTQLAKRKKN